MYLALKTLHLLAVVLFIGNIITGVFRKAHGDRSGNPRIMAHVMEGIIRSDRWFTLPGVFLLTEFGVAAAIRGGLPILGTGWISQSIVLLSIAGLVLGIRIGPLQAQLHRLARLAANGGAWDPDAYRRFSAAGNSGGWWPRRRRSPRWC